MAPSRIQVSWSVVRASRARSCSRSQDQRVVPSVRETRVTMAGGILTPRLAKVE